VRKSAIRRSPLRVKLRTILARRIRAMVDDPMVLRYGDPRRRINEDRTSISTVQLLQYDANDGAPVQMGRYCALHVGASIFHGGEHNLDWVGVLNAAWHDGNIDGNAAGAPRSRGPVVIGSDVYLGFEALVLSGVTIGDGAIIGARAVVTRDVAPFEVVGGNPAQHIKWRFDEPTRDALLRIRWWDWPHEKVLAHMDEINSPDVAGFIAKHDVPR
jgi:acetyltransferase-like isoleucine patch superfamily enzyme